MRKLIVLISVLLSFQALALELKIEKDPVFKSLIQEFEKPGENTLLYAESENYRLDLSLYDLVDKVSLITENTRFIKYKEDLNSIARKDLIYFYDWFKKVKKFADADKEFFKVLNKKLFIQLYSKNSVALLPNYKYIDFKKFKDMGLARRINRYNEIATSPEASGLLAAFEKTSHPIYTTKLLTVSKMKTIRSKDLKRVKKSYLKIYINLLAEQQLKDIESIDNPKKYSNIIFKTSKKNTIKAIAEASQNASIERYKDGLKIFNLLQGIQNKHEVLAFLSERLSEKGIQTPFQNGHILLTPRFIENHSKTVAEILKEYTVSKFIDVEHDEYALQVRRWVKKNNDKIKTDIQLYNKETKSTLSFKYENPRKLPSRVEILSQYEVLETLYPKLPWLKYAGADFINRNGKGKYLGKNKFWKNLGGSFKKLIKVENYLSLIAGTATLVLTGGNYSIALSTRNLLKKAIYTQKHDSEWNEFLKSAPKELITGFLLGAGFSAGRLYKILALGSAQGAIQSLVTGQDVKVGALVGTGMSLLNHYVLPYSLAKPMRSGFDSASLRANRYLEILEKTIKRSVQGTIVAALTGQDLLKAAAKGAGYGILTSSLSIWFLGTRYNAFKDYSAEDIDDYIDAENAFQNDVGRGYFQIDRQLIMDANYRVGGLWPKMISASQTLPGNIVMSDGGFNRLTTMTHEAHHLMQQHQSGVFGFYLMRYIPTFFRTGYGGHPDENFLRDFIADYL